MHPDDRSHPGKYILVLGLPKQKLRENSKKIMTYTLIFNLKRKDDDTGKLDGKVIKRHQ